MTSLRIFRLRILLRAFAVPSRRRLPPGEFLQRTFRRAGVVFLGLGIACGAGAEPLGELEIPVTFRVDPAEVDNAHSIRDLTRWRPADDYQHTLGLYQQRTRATVSVEGELLVFGSAALLRPTRASLDVATAHHIYVGAEFSPGSCQYEQALEHERTHEQIHIQAIEQLLPAIEHEVRAILRAAPASPRAPLQVQLQAVAAAAGNMASQMISDHTGTLHAAFDSPHEYERLQQACDGAMGGAIRSARMR